MSVSRVQPPQVHQQRDESAAAAGFAEQAAAPTVTLMFGIEIPEFVTCCIQV